MLFLKVEIIVGPGHRQPVANVGRIALVSRFLFCLLEIGLRCMPHIIRPSYDYGLCISRPQTAYLRRKEDKAAPRAASETVSVDPQRARSIT